MFGTWRYDPETDEVQNLRRAWDPITARCSQHQACNRCHEKKLKCSGAKDGCDRCAASGTVCVYNRPGPRSSRRGKRSSRPSTKSPSAAPREGSGSPRSTVSSPLTRHASKRGSRASSSQAPTPAAPAEVAVAAEAGGGDDRPPVPAGGGDARPPVPAGGGDARPPVPVGRGDAPAEAGYAMPARQQMFAGETHLQGGYEPLPVSHFFPPTQYPAAAPHHRQAWAAAAAHPAPSPRLDHSVPNYITAPEAMNGTGDGFLHYETYSNFDFYQGMDPRYWPPGPQ